MGIITRRKYFCLILSYSIEGTNSFPLIKPEIRSTSPSIPIHINSSGSLYSTSIYILCRITNDQENKTRDIELLRDSLLKIGLNNNRHDRI